MVFLGELLLGEPEWGPAHRSFNCMAMPKEHPAALKYAATAAVVLAHFQIEDQVADTRRWRWMAARRFFSLAYRKAAAEMRASGFPLDEMTALLGTQREREARAESLEDVAEPTARATEMVFGHGVRSVCPLPDGRGSDGDGWAAMGMKTPEEPPERAAAAKIGGPTRAARQGVFGSIGRGFGYLVYVLDAWEDRPRDRKSGDFNALLAFPEVNGRAEILAALESLERDLPSHLAARLRANVEERLGMRMRVLHGAAVCRKSAGERWKSAVEFARSMKEREKAGLVKGAVVLATVSVLAYFAPDQIRSAGSWRQCFGLAMNLMAVGAVFATVRIPETPPGGPEAKTGCWSRCGGCWCDSCDCGDCCDCGSCCG
jgi:hypothetical protein